MWTLFFILVSTKFIYYATEHVLDELVPHRQGERLAFLAVLVLLTTFLYFTCTEHRIQRMQTLEEEKEMLDLMLCGEDLCKQPSSSPNRSRAANPAAGHEKKNTPVDLTPANS